MSEVKKAYSNEPSGAKAKWVPARNALLDSWVKYIKLAARREKAAGR
jgi:hypothetical protein